VKSGQSLGVAGLCDKRGRRTLNNVLDWLLLLLVLSHISVDLGDLVIGLYSLDGLDIGRSVGHDISEKRIESFQLKPIVGSRVSERLTFGRVEEVGSTDTASV
jgi:hypothetical protein